MKPKILFIMHMPPPVHGAAMVGQYIHDSKVINEAFDCHYLNLTLARNLNDIGKGGIKKLVNFIRQLNKIRKTVKRIKPDTCYVTPNAKGGAFYKDFLVVMLLKQMRQNIVIHYHNKGVATRQDKTIDNFLYKRFFDGLKIILLADVLYGDIKKYVRKENVFICPNGIPTNTACNKHTANEIPHILFLSNMIASKGVWELVEACRILKEKGISFKCDFVGKWSDIAEDDFNAAIREKSLEDCVKAYGAKYGEEKEKCFDHTDIFVFPTYYNNECFPIVLLEAMQHGLPCISTTEGGIPNIIDNGKTGFIVEKHNATQLADKIAWLISHPKQSKEMGENGYRKYQKEFTLSVFENRMKEILMECIQ